MPAYYMLTLPTHLFILTEKNWGIRVPGYTDDVQLLLRRNASVLNPTANSLHRDRMNAVKKAMKDESLMNFEKTMASSSRRAKE
jgi:hypothetical protein